MMFSALKMYDVFEFGVLASIGARDRHLSPDGEWLMMRVGPSRPHREICVKVDENDMFVVQVVKHEKKAKKPIVEWLEMNIPKTKLNSVLLRAESEVWG